MIPFLLNGVGSIANEETTRATLLVRANCLAKEHSGICPIFVHQLIAYIKRGILPLIPEKGSVGASGELVPLSYIALAPINGTSFMSGFASLVISDAVELALVADLCTAMASEVMLEFFRK
ncbi:aromatic amino acid lyase [Bacillus cereus]|nr:aromatic amino acid lyase [Bacillus cereus]MEB9570802.1 aromatic amino acid lyase [Bacillus cereus]